ncbi:MAG: hypothetical protein EBU90_02140 [Proteobacteria bacterium]|nr:hypothetical protein [Pseudomonadota bacterium]NBP13282.1 hypothetical protein [bacterium]
MGIVKGSAFDLSKVTFSDVKTDVHGRKMVYVNGDSNGKIMVQTPKMYAPNGIKKWRKKDATDNKDDKFELELSFYGENRTDKNSQEISEFKKTWEDFDELIKDKVIEKSKEWLSMPKLDKATLESVMYTPMVKVPKDKEGNELPYPSRIRIKIDREMDTVGNFTGRFLSNKKFKTEVLLFDENKQTIQINEDIAETVVPKGSQVVCIMELVYLSLSKTTISTKWKLVQAKVFRNKDTINQYAMLDDEDSDLDTEEQAETGVEGALDNLNIETGVDFANVADDLDNDPEEQSEEQPEVPQPKARGRTKRGVQAL